MDAKTVTADFKRNKLKLSSSSNFLSARRSSWPPVPFETLRHTTRDRSYETPFRPENFSGKI
jgi:hypothetical protein